MPSLGFGIERLGLLAIKAPRLTLAIVILASVTSAFGIRNLTSDDALSELFRSNTKEFRDYKALSDRFPTSEYDILVVAESGNVMRREILEELRNFHLDVQFVEAVSGVLSMFSMRDPPSEEGLPPALIPETLPEGEEFEKLVVRVVKHPLIGGKLVSDRDESGQLALFVVSLKHDVVMHEGLGKSIREVESIAREILEPVGLKVSLSGAPVMQQEVRAAIKRDRLIYNTAGFVVGFIICLAFFRRPTLVFIASICPALSVLWSLGLLGHLNLKLNTFLNVIPPLVMVIALSDALHMVYSIRRQLGEGKNRFEACRHAILTVGPACVLTSLTTSTAMLSLTLTDSGLIRIFGMSAALSTLLAFVAVIVLVPTLTVLMVRDESSFKSSEKTLRKGLSFIEDFCAGIASWLQPRYFSVSLVGLTLIVAFTSMHLQLKPHYRLSEQLPDNKQAVAASETLDKKLTGALPIHIMIRWPESETITTPKVLNIVTEAHNVMERQAGVGNVWSVETLRIWLRENINDDSPKTVKDYIGQLPEHLTSRFLNESGNGAVITGRLPNLDASETVPIVQQISNKLDGLIKAEPGYDITVTGLSTLSALQSANMIEQLNRGLLAAIVVVIVLIGVAFRSFYVFCISIFPNLFPVVAAGSLLYLTGEGLEYASVIGLTVAFGLAVDDTIHFMNRLHLERSRNGELVEAVMQTIKRIGPVLILTTIVLVLGMSVTIISDLPPMRLFGELSMTMLSAALIADVILLPAIILAASKLGTAAKEAS